MKIWMLRIVIISGILSVASSVFATTISYLYSLNTNTDCTAYLSACEKQALQNINLYACSSTMKLHPNSNCSLLPVLNFSKSFSALTENEQKSLYKNLNDWLVKIKPASGNFILQNSNNSL